MIKWYCIPCQNEVESYHETDDWNDFPRGTFLVYSNCCLTTGFKSKEEAENWMKEHPCKKQEINHGQN